MQLPSLRPQPSSSERRPARTAGGLLARLRSWWRPACIGLALACVAGLVSPFLSSALADSNTIIAWLIDLATHWQWLFLLLLLLALPGACATDRRWVLLILAAPLPWCSAWILAPIAPAAPERPPSIEVLADVKPDVASMSAPLSEAVFSVASANVFFRNHDSAPLRRWLEQERPDAVVIVEFTPGFAESLQALSGFPYRKLLAQPDAFGIAILSRHPITQYEVVRDDDDRPMVKVRIRWAGREIGLAALHPMPPMTPHFHALRNRTLALLTPTTGWDDMPAIVAGDFNATPWSDAFDGPTQRGWRRATGLTPTWPMVWRGWMGIPIDHVLVTPQWQVVHSEVGPNLGSDHYPVLVRLALPKQGSADDR